MTFSTTLSGEEILMAPLNGVTIASNLETSLSSQGSQYVPAFQNQVLLRPPSNNCFIYNDFVHHSLLPSSLQQSHVTNEVLGCEVVVLLVICHCYGRSYRIEDNGGSLPRRKPMNRTTKCGPVCSPDYVRSMI